MQENWVLWGLGLASVSSFFAANYQYGRILYSWKSSGLPIKEYRGLLALLLLEKNKHPKGTVETYRLDTNAEGKKDSRSFVKRMFDVPYQWMSLWTDICFYQLLGGFLRKIFKHPFIPRQSSILNEAEIIGQAYAKIQGKVVAPAKLHQNLNGSNCVLTIQSAQKYVSSVEDEMQDILHSESPLRELDPVKENANLFTEKIYDALVKNPADLTGFQIEHISESWQCQLDDGTLVEILVTKEDDENQAVVYDLASLPNSEDRGLLLGSEVIVFGRLYLLHPFGLIMMPPQRKFIFKVPMILLSVPLSGEVMLQYEWRWNGWMAVAMTSGLVFTLKLIRLWLKI